MGEPLPIKAIYRLCLAAGWSEGDALVALCVAMQASGGDPWFQLVTSADEDKTVRGIFGLSVSRSDEQSRWEYFDPRRCARAAYDRWQARGGTWDGHYVWPIDNLAEMIWHYRVTLDLVEQKAS